MTTTIPNHLTRTFHSAVGGGDFFPWGALPGTRQPALMPLADTVRETLGLQCPNCGRDEWLIITAEIGITLRPDVHVILGAPRIEDHSHIGCGACWHQGTAAEFRVFTRIDQPFKIVE